MRPAPRKPPGLAVTARRGEAWPVSWASTLYFFCFCRVISVLSHVAGFAPAFRGAAHRGVLASAVPQREQMMLNWSPKLLVLSCTPQSANESSRGSTFASTLGHDAPLFSAGPRSVWPRPPGASSAFPPQQCVEHCRAQRVCEVPVGLLPTCPVELCPFLVTRSGSTRSASGPFEVMSITNTVSLGP